MCSELGSEKPLIELLTQAQVVMNSKKIDTGSKDLISNLPEPLIGHILSFLSTKEAALTSVLSKRWRFLLALVPNLDFDSSIYYKHPRRGNRKCYLMRPSFKAFVERTMLLQGNASLNKFSLRCRTRYDSARVDNWIANVLDRGVVELDLYISSDGDYPLPSKILMSKTLVRLNLGSGNEEFTIDDDIKEVFLPKLKSLYLLDDIVFEESGAKVAKILSGCPVLEEFVMIKAMWGLSEFCSVVSPTLKRVTICCEIIDENPRNVSFDTPNLVYLEFTDVVAIKYPKVNLSSLVEARLGLRLTPMQQDRARKPRDGYSSNEEEEEEEEGTDGNAADFLTGISNVKILYLSSDTLEVLNFCCKAIPVFKNLIHLTIETHQEVGWDSLPSLLENCPNLETIIFKGLHCKDRNKCEDERYRFNDTNICWDKDKDEYRCMCKPWDGIPISLSTSPVKTLKVLEFGEITGYKDDFDRQVDLIKYFVESMPNLEQVTIYWDTSFDDDLSIQLTEFHMLEKVASPKCKIQIISDNISYSCTVGSSSSTNGLAFLKNRFPV